MNSSSLASQSSDINNISVAFFTAWQRLLEQHGCVSCAGTVISPFKKRFNRFTTKSTIRVQACHSVVAAAAWNDIVSANLEALGKRGNVWS